MDFQYFHRLVRGRAIFPGAPMPGLLALESGLVKALLPVPNHAATC